MLRDNAKRQTVGDCVHLQPEKVIAPLLMISRKRYVGAFYMSPTETRPKVKYMG